MRSLLRVIDLSKSFGTLPVIQHVSFDIQEGEVVGLTGSVGSGKSVLVMMLAGLYAPDEGEIHFANKRLTWPFVTQSLGIGVVHQRPTLADQLDIVSNVFLGNEMGSPKNWGLLSKLDNIQMHQQTLHIFAQLGLPENILTEKIANLSIEQRQMVAIARVLTFPLRMVIIDEPTVLLSYPNQQRLIGLIQNWQEKGIAVLFSSNNVDHLFAVTDRIIVLHQTSKVADLRTDETSREEVVNLLLGKEAFQNVSPTLWDFDSFDRFRDHAEKLRYHQMLLEKDLAGEDALNRQLTKQLGEQVQALDLVNLALQEAQRRLILEREEERKHIAREIHDHVIQDLLSINYELESMEISESISSTLARELADARQGIRTLVDSLRRICGNLRPPTIDSLGLGAALQSYTRSWSARTGIQVNLDLDPNLGRLPEAIELSIFRIVQEGLSNVWRHAQASTVQIGLQHTTPRTLMISLQDDGKGLEEEIDLAKLSTAGHFGLLGISERVVLMGGRLRLQHLDEGGLLLLAEIPHPRVDPHLNDLS